MNRIEKGLHQHHASLRESGESKDVQSSSAGPSVEQNVQTSGRTTLDPPFAKVNAVAPSSPAHEAGLKVGDKIRNFGAVHWRNHDNLRRVSEVVQRQEGVGNILLLQYPWTNAILLANDLGKDSSRRSIATIFPRIRASAYT